MIKTLRIAAAGVLAAGAATAGAVAYVAPAAPVMVEEPAQMGGSGMWLIPLIAIALIALAVSQNQNNGSQIN